MAKYFQSDEIPDIGEEENIDPKNIKKRSGSKKSINKENEADSKSDEGVFKIAMDNYKIVLGVLILVIIAGLVIWVFFSYKPKEEQKKLQEYASGILPGYNSERAKEDELEELMSHQRTLTETVPQPPIENPVVPENNVPRPVPVVPEPDAPRPVPVVPEPDVPRPVPVVPGNDIPVPKPILKEEPVVTFIETPTIATYNPESTIADSDMAKNNTVSNEFSLE